MTRRSFPFFHTAPYLAVAVLGFALVASATAVPRPGPRLSRGVDLVELIRREDARVRDLRAQVDALARQLEHLRERAAGSEGRVAKLRRDIDALAPLAGLTPVRGPGLVAELRDSTLDEAPSGDPNDLVIHEEYLQAVVNALWAGGAEAIAVNGERITALSAIRCVGNTLLLHGAVYSPPYRIHAIGDRTTLLEHIGADPLVERFRIVAEKYRLGFDVREEARLSLPAFRGVLVTRFADPADD